jgi:5'-nucleotidase
MKKILYLDIDGVLADFDAEIERKSPGTLKLIGKARRNTVHGIAGETPGFFEHLPLIDGAKEATNILFSLYEVYFLSTPMWDVPNSFFGKCLWLEKNFGENARKRLILTHRKDLQIGDYLVDDRKKHGSENFKGEFIHFGQRPFENWAKVLPYLVDRSSL